MFSLRTIKIAIITIIVFLLFASNTWWFLYEQELKTEVSTLQVLAHRQTILGHTLSFSILFIDKVLNAKGEVTFEDRLQIENAVRDLEDPEILDRWKQFTESKTEEEAQMNVKVLLSLLIHRLAGIK